MDDDDVVFAERSEAVVVECNASPKDELRLYCGRCCSQPFMYFAALVLSLLNDGARNYCHSRSRCINIVCICDSTAGRGAASITLIMLLMVPIDSSRQELSNGCHIVILSNFDFISEISVDLATVCCVLDPFLAEFTDKRCSNEAVDTTNR